MKGKPIHIAPPQMIISSDAAKKGGWGAASQGISTGGTWTQAESQLHINTLELIAAELAIKTFTKGKEVSSIHIQMDNTVALCYLTKMGGTRSQELNIISKRIWQYLLEREITPTAEWIPTHLNVTADRESLNVKDSSEWKLNTNIFHRLALRWSNPEIDLFSSRTSHRLPQYVSLKANPQCTQVGAFQRNWGKLFPYAFPPFCLILKTLRKVCREQVKGMILITPLWSTQPWYPLALIMSIKKLCFNTNEHSNNKGSARGEPPTYIELHNEIGGLDGLRRSLSNEGISREATQFIACARREGTRYNYETAWRKWAVWCGEREMDPFECSLTYILDFLTYLFNERKLEYRTSGVYRSTIAAYHVPINGVSVGKHPRVTALMTGISNIRPPQPKCCTIWDVEDVLNQLRTWPQNELLSPKQLTFKLVMLIALTAINRGSEIHKLDTRFMGITKTKAVFSLGSTVKHSR